MNNILLIYTDLKDIFVCGEKYAIKNQDLILLKINKLNQDGNLCELNFENGYKIDVLNVCQILYDNV